MAKPDCEIASATERLRSNQLTIAVVTERKPPRLEPSATIR